MRFKKLSKILIANRGEIVKRIATTAQMMGIRTACLTDRTVPPIFLSGVIDDFIKVAEETPALFLDKRALIRFARDADCDGIHPGYGFLSENHEFAQMVVQAGLKWIGPPPAAMASMANKNGAREIAMAHQVPCIPGLTGLVTDVSEESQTRVLRFAEQFGYPLLIKAAMGGGGKGMRIVESPADLRDGLVRAYSEALNSFGDGSLIIERYIRSARHVEVQILADAHGRALAVGDRDCSMQRRHQKVVEEAPAPDLPAAIRSNLHRCAVKLAEAVGYQSCGTVEFVVDKLALQQGKTEQAFFFLEMNTRLQVEHPVTEEVYGLDLVAWQLRIAEGEALPQAWNPSPQGHALEVRIYAEDPDQGFFPSPGRLYGFAKDDAPGVRWEIGLDPISEVSTRFDPMIAKLVVRAEDRGTAIKRMKQALGKTLLAGPKTNLSFLGEVLAHPLFNQFQFDTSFIGNHLAALNRSVTDRRSHEGAAVATIIDRLHRCAGTFNRASVPRKMDVATIAFWAFGQAPASADPDDHLVIIDECEGYSPIYPSTAVFNGTGQFKAESFRYCYVRDGRRRLCFVLWKGLIYQDIKEPAQLQRVSVGKSTSADITSPFPGRLLKLQIGAGQTIVAQQTLCIIESMKMEMAVKSDRSAKIKRVHILEGQQVVAGQLLISLEDE